MSVRSKNHRFNIVRAVCAALLALVCCSALSGCLVAGFGSNNDADAILPGGLGLVFILGFALWFMLRKR